MIETNKKKFRPQILQNLAAFPGYVENHDHIESLNNILNELDIMGFEKLVQNFCTQIDPDNAEDFLFEVWICRMLLKNLEVQKLQYEPSDENALPDFRFRFQDINFDLQLKRLHNIKNEITKCLFVRECRKHLSSIPQPRLINFSISASFTSQDLNSFFSYVKGSLKSFSSARSMETLLGEPQYSWPADGMPLITFSFFEKLNSEQGISPGIIQLIGTTTGSMEEFPIEAFRKGVKRILKKSRKSLQRSVSPTQTNIVVMQAVHPILFTDKLLPFVLYGPDGLFCSGSFSNISGLILVPTTSWCLDESFKGQYFPNRMHHQYDLSNRGLFDGMDVYP